MAFLWGGKTGSRPRRSIDANVSDLKAYACRPCGENGRAEFRKWQGPLCSEVLCLCAVPAHELPRNPTAGGRQETVHSEAPTAAAEPRTAKPEKSASSRPETARSMRRYITCALPVRASNKARTQNAARCASKMYKVASQHMRATKSAIPTLPTALGG